MLASKLMIGSISFLKPGIRHLESRINNHASQLRFWEQFPEDFPYYRVEIFWDESTEKRLETNMSINSIKVNEPCPPGKSRNLLLEQLYASDYDYLICCDDDQILDPTNEAFDFLRKLSPDLAKQGALITFQNETWLTGSQCRKTISLRTSPQFARLHILKKALCTGNMQISCIPNLVKYGKEPVFFDNESMAQEGEIPEDAKFLVDWIVAGNPIYKCETLFNVALDNYVQSSIYKTGTYRYTTSKSRIAVLDAYIRSKYPRIPEINTLTALSKRKNPAAASITLPKDCVPEKLLREEKLLKRR